MSKPVLGAILGGGVIGSAAGMAVHGLTGFAPLWLYLLLGLGAMLAVATLMDSWAARQERRAARRLKRRMPVVERMIRGRRG